MAVPLAITDAQIEEWILKSDENWKHKVGKHWKAKKFLGKGGFGIVGLWEYEGPARTAPEITQVVVKQLCEDLALSEPPWGGDMTGLSEGLMLQKLSRVQTKHIIKMYGSNKTGDKYYEMNRVVRIFLEFCPGGDLEQLLSGLDDNKNPLPREEMYNEADMWMIFWCLALGVLAMSRGTEISSEPAWGRDSNRPLPRDLQTEICHFDIKADNLLFGFRDANHPRFPTLKIADFGEACEVKDVIWQDDDYGGQFTMRGNQDTAPPEQTLNFRGNVFANYPLYNPRKGNCSNIFQIGCIMNSLLLGQKLHFNRAGTVLYKSDLNQVLRGNYHHAQSLETEDITKMYSANLRALVTECLLREALKRPSAIELVNRCKAGKKRADEAMASIGMQPGNFPDRLTNMPSIPLKNPEPPVEWLDDLDESEYVMSDEMFADLSALPSQPTQSPLRTGLGFGNFALALQQGAGMISPPTTPQRILDNLGGLFGRGPRTTSTAPP